MNIDVNEHLVRSATLRLGGRLDALSAPALRERLDRLAADGVHRLTVDLADVEFVDSAGLAALVRAMKTSREHGGDVDLVRPRADAAYRVFELTKFDAVFTIRRPG